MFKILINYCCSPGNVYEKLIFSDNFTANLKNRNRTEKSHSKEFLFSASIFPNCYFLLIKK
jgi:hypothetical protein